MLQAVCLALVCGLGTSDRLEALIASSVGFGCILENCRCVFPVLQPTGTDFPQAFLVQWLKVDRGASLTSQGTSCVSCSARLRGGSVAHATSVQAFLSLCV